MDDFLDKDIFVVTATCLPSARHAKAGIRLDAPKAVEAALCSGDTGLTILLAEK
jgi:hypothetical protein